MARTPAQRGRIGNWLVESRLARGWDTQERARTEISRLTGWKVPQSVYAEWESGRRLPSDANLSRLQEFYGGGPERPLEPPADSQSIVAAIDRQTAAIEALTTTMRDGLDRGVGVQQGLAGSLLDLLTRLASEHVDNADGRKSLRAARR